MDPGDFPAPPGFPKVPSATPGLTVHWADWNADYTPMGQVELMNAWGSTGSHERTYDYDELNEPTAASVDRDEWGTGIAPREFTYTREIVGGFYTGKMTRLGPDGVETIVQLDVANRTEWVVRRIPDPPIELIRADYTYYANGLVDTVTYGNGAMTEYTYDDAGQVKIIDHRNEVGLTMLQLRYYYDGRGLPWLVAEDHAVTGAAQTTFAYDDRGRLIEESRSGQLRYWRGYEYDQGGNRTKMTDLENDLEVVYHYDLEDPDLYGSANNRLIDSKKFDISARRATPLSSPLIEGGLEGGDPGPDDALSSPLDEGGPEGGDPGRDGVLTASSPLNEGGAAGGGPPRDGVLLSTTWYYYNGVGNVTRVVTHPESTEDYSATRLVYAVNGNAVSYVMGETWTWDGVAPWPDNYDITYAREFRYDGPRQRYLNRELDTDQLQEYGLLVSVSETWSDYDGNAIVSAHQNHC